MARSFALLTSMLLLPSSAIAQEKPVVGLVPQASKPIKVITSPLEKLLHGNPGAKK